MEVIQGGVNPYDVGSGMACVLGIGALAVSTTATVLSGGILGYGMLWSMGVAASSCVMFAGSVAYGGR